MIAGVETFNTASYNEYFDKATDSPLQLKENHSFFAVLAIGLMVIDSVIFHFAFLANLSPQPSPAFEMMDDELGKLLFRMASL